MTLSDANARTKARKILSVQFFPIGASQTEKNLPQQKCYGRLFHCVISLAVLLFLKGKNGFVSNSSPHPAKSPIRRGQ